MGEKTSFNVMTHQFLNTTTRQLYFIWQFPYKPIFVRALCLNSASNLIIQLQYSYKIKADKETNQGCKAIYIYILTAQQGLNSAVNFSLFKRVKPNIILD